MKSPLFNSLLGEPEATAGQTRLFDMRVAEFRRVGVHVVVVNRYDEIDAIVGKLVARCRPPQVMISGSAPGDRERTAIDGVYPTAPIPEHITTVAAALGARLVEMGIAAVAGGEVGAIVGYEMMRRLAGREADPTRFTLIRRRQDASVGPPNHRLGTIVFTGEDPTDLRSAALREVRALLVLGGGDGTETEIDQALGMGLGVVPVGRTGGTAEACWQRMREDLDSQRLGGRPIEVEDFDRLMSEDVDNAADAAVRLLAQAMFLA